MQATKLFTTRLTQHFPLEVLLSLLAVYFIWGSTYLALRIAVVEIPPFLLVGTRFALAGGLMLAWLRWRGASVACVESGTVVPTRSAFLSRQLCWRGAPLPSSKQWLHSAIVGLLLLGVGNGGVTFAEQWVSSSLAAAVVATAPLWVALFSGLTGQWPNRSEWIGIVIGFVGVVLLNLEGDLRASPFGAIALVFAPIGWAIGSVLSRKLSLPHGAMGTAAEMLTAGPVLIAFGLLRGEPVPNVAALSWPAIGAWLYLVTFGSIIAFTAYMFLIRTVRPALALSYTYINPVVALGLGMLFGERLGWMGFLGIGIIVIGVIFITLMRTPQPPVIESAAD